MDIRTQVDWMEEFRRLALKAALLLAVKFPSLKGVVDPEDAASEVLCRFWQTTSWDHTRSPLRAYLQGILLNVFLEHVRLNGRMHLDRYSQPVVPCDPSLGGASATAIEWAAVRARLGDQPALIKIADALERVDWSRKNMNDQLVTATGLEKRVVISGLQKLRRMAKKLGEQNDQLRITQRCRRCPNAAASGAGR